jgi:hypothetical protein
VHPVPAARSLPSLLLSLLAATAPIVAQGGDVAGELERADALSRHGITWRFDAAYVTGTFVNGDPWVVGPVRITAIEPRSVDVGGRIVHGSMIDPDPALLRQGYDSALGGDEYRDRYDAAANVALGVSRQQSLLLLPDRSLVSVQSRPDAKDIPTLQSAAVLTCLAVPPAPDAFRPPYVRGDKTVQHRAVELDFAVLRRLPLLASVPPIDSVARGFERVWLDHLPDGSVRYLHPLENMPDQGREFAARVGSAGLLLNLDLPDAQKRPLAIRLVQLGIDLHGCLRGGCRWRGEGGNGSGRKFPILFAGAMLGDERLLAVGREFAEEGGRFAEDGQTFYVRETAPGVWNGGHGGYRREHDGLPEWGSAHADRPELDRAAWNADAMRLCCTANGWVGQALAARVMGLQPAWSHPAFFDYMDRYLQTAHGEAWQRAWVGWHAELWDAYRSNY